MTTLLMNYTVDHMPNEDIIALLQATGDTISLADALRLIAEYGGGDMTQFRAIFLLKTAFPKLPLRLATEASTSIHIIGEGGLSDLEVSQLFKISD